MKEYMYTIQTRQVGPDEISPQTSSALPGIPVVVPVVVETPYPMIHVELYPVLYTVLGRVHVYACTSGRSSALVESLLVVCASYHWFSTAVVVSCDLGRQ